MPLPHMTAHDLQALTAADRAAAPHPNQIMAASKSNTRSKASVQERRRINLSGADEIRNWTEILGVTEEDLRKAIAAVGEQPDKVREHLGKK